MDRQKMIVQYLIARGCHIVDDQSIDHVRLATPLQTDEYFVSGKGQVRLGESLVESTIIHVDFEKMANYLARMKES